MREKLTSRKFWVSTFVLLVLAFGQALGLDVPTDRAWELAAVVSTYVFGQSYVDRALVERATGAQGGERR